METAGKYLRHQLSAPTYNKFMFYHQFVFLRLTHAMITYNTPSLNEVKRIYIQI